MRLFAAFGISGNLRNTASEFINGILKLQQHGIKPVEPENLHLTLKFIGKYPDNGIEALMNVLKEIHAEETSIECLGAGYFPVNGPEPRVLWLGFKKNETLRRIHEAIDRNLFSIGIERDQLPYQPHLPLQD